MSFDSLKRQFQLRDSESIPETNEFKGILIQAIPSGSFAKLLNNFNVEKKKRL